MNPTVAGVIASGLGETAQYFKNKTCILTPYPVRFNESDRIYDKAKLLQDYSIQLFLLLIVIAFAIPVPPTILLI